MRQGAHAEDVGHSLAQIGKRRAGSEVDAGRAMRAGRQHRHVLARVIGARRGRVVAVVGGDDEQVVRPQAPEDSGSLSSNRSRLSAYPARRSGARTCVSKSTRFAKMKPVGCSCIAPSTAVHASVV